MKQPDKPNLYDHDAEAAVIGALLIDPLGIGEVETVLKPSHFHQPDYRAIYEKILEVRHSGGTIDTVTVKAKLPDVEGNEFYWQDIMLDCQEAVPNALLVGEYAKVVLEFAIRRGMINLCQTVAKRSMNTDMPLLDVVNTMNEGMSGVIDSMAGGKATQTASAGQVGMEYLQELDRSIQTGETPPLVPSGIGWLDDRLDGGFEFSTVASVFARPSNFKTGMAIWMALAAAMAGYNTMFFTIEMVRKRIMERMISAVSLIPWKNNKYYLKGVNEPLPVGLAKLYQQSIMYTKTGYMPETKYHAIAGAVGFINDLPLDINDGTGHTPESIRMIVTAQRPQVVFIDYILLMGDARGDQAVLNKYYDQLQALAKDTNTLIVVLNQVGRTAKDNGRLKKGDIYFGGEQQSDYMIGLRLMPDADFVGVFGAKVLNLDLAKSKEGIADTSAAVPVNLPSRAIMGGYREDMTGGVD